MIPGAEVSDRVDLVESYKCRRRRGGRPARETICGRRNCRRCRRWRLIIDFPVQSWGDRRRTAPLRFKPDCDHCQAVIARTRRRLRKQSQQESERVASILADMSKEKRIEYELEGCLPISVCGFVLEDLDPTPLPQGCPECWKSPGNGWVCDSCPDSDAKEKRRQDLRQGLALTT